MAQLDQDGLLAAADRLVGLPPRRASAEKKRPLSCAREPVRGPKPIHERDIAAVAVQALLSDGHEGATYELTGPESMTLRRQVELIPAAIGRPVTVVDLAGDAARAQLEEQYGAFGVPGFVDSVLATYAASVGTAAPVTDTVARITGRAPAAFADWAVSIVRRLIQLISAVARSVTFRAPHLLGVFGFSAAGGSLTSPRC
ncbi:hypothetical protein [Streptomyces camelliae]|uniref:Uncharacterized protein n=1 Tax=Streptomyces camelliae TaxID=3004093 RepID=A0ABY7PIN0_9ACTN|nr:hypothetical protein [Streptomyces sp. HUAS 2-6]WBO69580.1 hypothetical protein O1G22_43300 [Streptomyces sp. HUAS 2-6]